MTDTELFNLELRVKGLRRISDQIKECGSLIKGLNSYGGTAEIVISDPLHNASCRMTIDSEARLEIIKILERQRDKYLKELNDANLCDNTIQ